MISENAPQTKIDVFLLEAADPLLGTVLGCDIRVLDPEATAADLMDALDCFAAAHLADCKGCDGCCQERAPLTAADLGLLTRALPQPTADADYPAHRVVERFGCLEVTDGVSDIYLRRDTDSVCRQLDREHSCCSIWPYRPFVCRSHFCLPRSERLELLRQDIVNLGINELTRLLLAEEAIGAPPLEGGPLASCLAPADYGTSAISGKTSCEQIRLRDCVAPELWQRLLLTADAPEGGR